MDYMNLEKIDIGDQCFRVCPFFGLMFGEVSAEWSGGLYIWWDHINTNCKHNRIRFLKYNPDYELDEIDKDKIYFITEKERMILQLKN